MLAIVIPMNATIQKPAHVSSELERISEEIHGRRKEKKGLQHVLVRRPLGERGRGVGAEHPDPPLHSEAGRGENAIFSLRKSSLPLFSFLASPSFSDRPERLFDKEKEPLGATIDAVSSSASSSANPSPAAAAPAYQRLDDKEEAEADEESSSTDGADEDEDDCEGDEEGVSADTLKGGKTSSTPSSSSGGLVKVDYENEASDCESTMR